MNKLCEQHSFHISAFHIIDYPSQFCCRRKKNPLLFPINYSNFNCHYRKSFFLLSSFPFFFFSTQTRFKSWKNRLCVIGWCAKKKEKKYPGSMTSAGKRSIYFGADRCHNPQLVLQMFSR